MRIIVEGLYPYIDFLIDSGAHSNYHELILNLNGKSAGTMVDLGNYLDYLYTVKGKVWDYITLDAIKNPAATNRNLEKFLENGLTPMCVLIINSPIDQVNELMKINRRVAVAGGVNAAGVTNIYNRFMDIYRASGNQVYIHALGYGRYPDTLRLPIKSSDSSSWCSGGQFGSIGRYNEHGFDKIDWKQFFTGIGLSKSTRTDWIYFLINGLGVPKEWLFDRVYYRTTSSISQISVGLSYLKFQLDCFQRGIRYFLAVVNTGWFSSLIGTVAGVTLSMDRADYKISRALIHRLNALVQENRLPEYIDICKDVLMEKTAWETKLPY